MDDNSRLVKAVTRLLKDDVQIKEEEIADIPDLPDADSVIEGLTKKLKKKTSSDTKE